MTFTQSAPRGRDGSALVITPLRDGYKFDHQRSCRMGGAMGVPIRCAQVPRLGALAMRLGPNVLDPVLIDYRPGEGSGFPALGMLANTNETAMPPRS